MKQITLFIATLTLIFATTQFGFSQTNKSQNARLVNQQQAAQVPVTAGLGAVVLTGVGIMTGGLVTWANGSENVDLYNTHLEPSDDFYTAQDLTRDVFMEDSDAQVKKGKIFTFAGGAVVAIAGGVLINRIIKLNKIKKSRLSVNPYLSPSFQSNKKMNYGIAVSANF